MDCVVQERRATVTLFFILSMAVLVLYWAWFGFLKYGMGDGEASKEVSCHGIIARNVLVNTFPDAGHRQHPDHHLPHPPPSYHPAVQSSWFSFIRTPPESVCLNTS